MEPEKQAVVLYDFLYRDLSRVASYYAQIFRGRLSTLEETDTESDSLEISGKGNIQIAQAEVKSGQAAQSSSKRIIDPHDVITTDILSYLMEKQDVSEDVANALHGSLIIAQGTLSVIDHKILELATSALEHEVTEQKRNARTKQEKEAVRTGEMVVKVLQKVQMPSAFLLSITDGTVISGTIKENGMEELISTYYFKYGAEGVADVFVIGIKEIPSPTIALPVESLFGASQQIARGFNQALFPVDSIKVTPFALFRKI